MVYTSNFQQTIFDWQLAYLFIFALLFSLYLQDSANLPFNHLQITFRIPQVCAYKLIKFKLYNLTNCILGYGSLSQFYPFELLFEYNINLIQFMYKMKNREHKKTENERREKKRRPELLGAVERYIHIQLATKSLIVLSFISPSVEYSSGINGQFVPNNNWITL